MRFVMIDRITSWQVGRSAEAIKNISLSEDFFDDHFPRRPVMPGVLVLEGLAQLSGFLLEVSLQEQQGRKARALLSILERTKFRHVAVPGDSLVYRTEVSSLNADGARTTVTALRGGRVLATSSMIFSFVDMDDPELDRIRDSLLRLWMGESPENPHATR